MSEPGAGLGGAVPSWTLRRRLAALAAEGQISAEGRTRSRRYRVAASAPAWTFSADAAAVVARVTRPLHQRTPVSYDRALLDDYVPNVTSYLDGADRDALRVMGTTSG